MRKGEPAKSDLEKLRKGIEKSKDKENQELTLPELAHELTVYEVELKMQNISLFDTLEKLTAAHNEYEELFELSPVGYFILDKNGIIQKVNERGSEQLGLDRLQLVKRHFSIFLNSEFDQDNFYRHMNLVMEDGRPGRLVCDIKKFGGGFFTAVIKTKITRDEHLKFKNLLLMVSDTP
ncbi:PAS domain-containing protein [Mucilaginibacter gotjawali]|uniref:PAS domain S-box-containing protein n=2 Tax=Mucilaginibacter gotjawali TaxID=1550579 RepID=A0A839S8S7_9SPHI|nr:PAS domain-containing protein [Mucilaginibacter gotjawali]MBB3053772.1 PAS domain S-box-containing protein [Mucilaginibacter gotjawali]BAU54034.1 PAS fold protein [Mucilaginibacter gotjawali]